MVGPLFVSLQQCVIYTEMVWSAPDIQMSIYVCMSETGRWSQNEYFSAAFPLSVLQESTHINQFELLTVVFSLRLWSANFMKTRIQIYCNIEVSVSVINTCHTRDSKMLQVIREITFICSTCNFQIKSVIFLVF